MKERKCIICGVNHNEGRNRPQLACVDCYPLYRRSLNILKSAEHRAHKKGLEFDLDLDWVVRKLKGKCPKLGFRFRFDYSGAGYKDRHPLTPSIDKIDPCKGCTKDNCQIVCWWYNVSKQRFTEEMMDNLCRLYVHYQDEVLGGKIP